MPNYYVNRNPQPPDEYEVHDIGKEHLCRNPAHEDNREPLGHYAYCHLALAEAESRGFRPADGCKYCVPECHKR